MLCSNCGKKLGFFTKVCRNCKASITRDQKARRELAFGLSIYGIVVAIFVTVGIGSVFDSGVPTVVAVFLAFLVCVLGTVGVVSGQIPIVATPRKRKSIEAKTTNPPCPECSGPTKWFVSGWFCKNWPTCGGHIDAGCISEQPPRLESVLPGLAKNITALVGATRRPSSPDPPMRYDRLVAGEPFDHVNVCDKPATPVAVERSVPAQSAPAIYSENGVSLELESPAGPVPVVPAPAKPQPSLPPAVQLHPLVVAHDESHVALDIGINNQGRVRSDNVAPLECDGLRFRSQPEINLYRALKQFGVPFAPLPVFVRGGQEYIRAEPDFVVLYRGVVLVIEVDGATTHRESPADAYDRTEMFSNEGARVVRVRASRCMSIDDAIVCADGLFRQVDHLKDREQPTP